MFAKNVFEIQGKAESKIISDYFYNSKKYNFKQLNTLRDDMEIKVLLYKLNTMIIENNLFYPGDYCKTTSTGCATINNVDYDNVSKEETFIGKFADKALYKSVTTNLDNNEILKTEYSYRDYDIQNGCSINCKIPQTLSKNLSK